MITLKRRHKALRASVAHWKRLIRRAEKKKQSGERIQPGRARLGDEGWLSDDCAMCRLYSVEGRLLCDDCRLNCDDFSFWQALDTSDCWSLWLIWARRQLNLLQGILKIETITRQPVERVEYSTSHATLRVTLM